MGDKEKLYKYCWCIGGAKRQVSPHNEAKKCFVLFIPAVLVRGVLFGRASRPEPAGASLVPRSASSKRTATSITGAKRQGILFGRASRPEPAQMNTTPRTRHPEQGTPGKILGASRR